MVAPPKAPHWEVVKGGFESLCERGLQQDTSRLRWKHVGDVGCTVLSCLDLTSVLSPIPVAHPSDPGIKTLTERPVQQHSLCGAACSGHRMYRQETSALENTGDSVD